MSSAPRRHRTGLVAAITAALTLLLLPIPVAGAQNPEVTSDRRAREFDLQAHRGGSTHVVESTLAAFRHAAEMGVTTLELDYQVTADGQAIVGHDSTISPKKCLSTQPVQPGDPMFPYNDKNVRDLTAEQIRSMDCGSQRIGSNSDQILAPGAQMPLLQEVLDLAQDYPQLRFNIETKLNPLNSASAQEFVDVLLPIVAPHRDRVVVQSFVWETLRLIRAQDSDLGLYALISGMPPEGWDEVGQFINTGQLQAALAFGASATSPSWGYSADPADALSGPRYVDAAHTLGMKVVPWTVNDADVMRQQIRAGVDGIITDNPGLLRQILAEEGYRLPVPGVGGPAVLVDADVADPVALAGEREDGARETLAQQALPQETLAQEAAVDGVDGGGVNGAGAQNGEEAGRRTALPAAQPRHNAGVGAATGSRATGLANTGAAVDLLALGAVALVVIGAVVMRLARRRLTEGADATDPLQGVE